MEEKKYFRVFMSETFYREFLVKAKDEDEARDLIEGRFCDDVLNCHDSYDDVEWESHSVEPVRKEAVIGEIAQIPYDDESGDDTEIVA